MWHNFLLYPVHSILYRTYARIFNTIIDVHYWFFKIPIVWKLDDVIFNRNHCCECGKEINYDDIDIKVSTRAFKHTECFDYYSRSARE